MEGNIIVLLGIALILWALSSIANIILAIKTLNKPAIPIYELPMIKTPEQRVVEKYSQVDPWEENMLGCGDGKVIQTIPEEYKK